METKYKYCWLNTATGEFSQTWDELTHKILEKNILELGKNSSYWKLIKFQCLTDDKFEFTQRMKLR